MQLYYLYCCLTCSTCSKYLEAGGSYLILNKRVMIAIWYNEDKLYNIYSGKKAHKTKRTIAFMMTTMCIKLYHRKRKELHKLACVLKRELLFLQRFGDMMCSWRRYSVTDQHANPPHVFWGWGFNSGVCWNSHVSNLNLWLGKLQDSEKITTMSTSKI